MDVADKTELDEKLVKEKGSLNRVESLLIEKDFILDFLRFFLLKNSVLGVIHVGYIEKSIRFILDFKT